MSTSPTASHVPTPATAATAKPKPVPPSRRRAYLLAGAVAAAVLVVGVIIFAVARRGGSELPNLNADTTTLTKLVASSAVTQTPGADAPTRE